MKSYFEPTGGLIMSIGKDLIKDLPAALVELVKNSYDADASYVKITYLHILNIFKVKSREMIYIQLYQVT